MQSTVKLYGNLKRYAPQKKENVVVEIAEGTTIAALLARLGVPEEGVWMSAVNDTVVDSATVLRDGDLLEVFKPVGGGVSKKSKGKSEKCESERTCHNE